MRLNIQRGQRRRSGDTWTQQDRVIVDGRLLRGYIQTVGRRKRPEKVVTVYGSDIRKGSEPYWLMTRNGIDTAEGGA